MNIIVWNRSPFGRGGRGYNYKSFADVLDSENDISFVSSGRPSTDRSSYAYDFSDSAPPSRLSTSSETSFGSVRGGHKVLDLSNLQDYSPFSPDSARTSVSGSSSLVSSLGHFDNTIFLDFPVPQQFFQSLFNRFTSSDQLLISYKRYIFLIHRMKSKLK